MKSFSQSSFSRFFKKFPALFLAGLMFSLPFSLFTGMFVLLGFLTGFNNIIIWGLGIIPSAPFFAGLVMVIRKISVDKTDENIFQLFLSTVKENLKKSLINGIVFYIITACSFFAVIYYGSLAQTDIIYTSLFTLYILFTCLLLSMMFYVPLLTVTYELRLIDIYKNSFLLIFGKILRNIAALVMLLVVSGAAFLAILYSEGVMIWISIALTVLLYPLITTYIVNSIIAKGVQETVGYFTGSNIIHSLSEEEAEAEHTAVTNADKTSDYVFVNGRMIKNTKKIDSSSNDFTQ